MQGLGDNLDLELLRGVDERECERLTLYKWDAGDG